MGLFAIGDLHLPGGDEKPMNVFGPHWEDHFRRIGEDWRQRVGEDDVVLIPGDISWAMQLAAARADLDAIGALPGRKIILKGNHDYWWASISQVRDALPESMLALQNDAVKLADCVVCGSRGWVFPTPGSTLTPGDDKIYRREMMRLDMSLKAAMKLRGEEPLVVMMHYPPLYDLARDTGFTEVLEQYPVSRVVYGHLHGAGVRAGYTGWHHGIHYQLTSCDSLDFRLAEVTLDPQEDGAE